MIVKISNFIRIIRTKIRKFISMFNPIILCILIISDYKIKFNNILLYNTNNYHNEAYNNYHY